MGRLLGKFFGASYVQETPSGTVDGTNAAFTLSQTPVGQSSLVMFLDGVMQAPADYTYSGVTVTFGTAPAVSQTVSAFYIKQS